MQRVTSWLLFAAVVWAWGGAPAGEADVHQVQPLTAADIDALEGGAKVHALVERVVATQRSLRTLRAQFTQVKTSTMLLDPLESGGEFAFRAPDTVRWDFSRPDAMVVLFADDTMTTYHPQRRRAETVKLSKRHRRFVRVLAGTQPLDDLASQFRIALADPGADRPYRLTLSPTHSVIKKKLRSVVLEVDRQLMLPVVVEYHETDGDVTRYEFQSLELNLDLDEARFRLELGDDVMVETIDASSGIG